MTFNLDLIQGIPESERIEIDGVRHYVLEDGCHKPYPSVTTVVETDPGKQRSLLAWRQRVGDKNADHISDQAADTGSKAHKLIENYIRGDELDFSQCGLVAQDMFHRLQQTADEHINNVRMIEQQMVSHHLRVAGTVDLVAEWDQQLAIIDWKTSRKQKRVEYIDGYFMQESAYAVMVEEMTGIPITKLVTVIATLDGHLQVFESERDQWIDKFIALRSRMAD